MNSSDLVKYLNGRSDGASMSEIAGYFDKEEEIEIKRVIRACLDLETIYKTGEKRGTRYFSKEVVENTTDQSDEMSENTDLEIHRLLSKKEPIQGDLFVCRKDFILTEDAVDPGGNLTFLKDGVCYKDYRLRFDKVKGKNVVADVKDRLMYNSIAITNNKAFEDDTFIITFYDYTGRYNEKTGANVECQGLIKHVRCNSYIELREKLKELISNE